jgi:hypothetical protein
VRKESEGSMLLLLLLLLLLPIITQPPRAHTKQLLVTSPINLRIL